MSPDPFFQVLPTGTNLKDGSKPSFIAGLLVVEKMPFPSARHNTSATNALAIPCRECLGETET